MKSPYTTYNAPLRNIVISVHSGVYNIDLYHIPVLSYFNSINFFNFNVTWHAIVLENKSKMLQPLRVHGGHVGFWFDFWCSNATFSNISVISCRPVLVVEEARVPGKNYRPTGKLYHLRLRVECTLFCNLQSRARTHAVLVIDLYELLDNPTT